MFALPEVALLVEDVFPLGLQVFLFHMPANKVVILLVNINSCSILCLELVNENKL